MTPPEVSLNEIENKENLLISIKNGIKLNPVFDSLNSPDTLINHIEQIIKKKKVTPHTEIFHQLIEQFEPLDFEALAFPEVEKLRKQIEDPNTETEQIKDIEKRLSDFLTLIL